MTTVLDPASSYGAAEAIGVTAIDPEDAALAAQLAVERTCGPDAPPLLAILGPGRAHRPRFRAAPGGPGSPLTRSAAGPRAKAGTAGDRNGRPGFYWANGEAGEGSG